jgi:hypothetical protein
MIPNYPFSMTMNPCFLVSSTDLCQQETMVKATNHHVLVLTAALLQLSSLSVTCSNQEI